MDPRTLIGSQLPDIETQKKERKKEQNRIAQRNYRHNQRKRVRELEIAAGRLIATPESTKSAAINRLMTDTLPICRSPPPAASSTQDVAQPSITGFSPTALLGEDLSHWHRNPTPARTLPHSGDGEANLGRGRTPLHLAIQNGNESMARLLLERGADITMRDGNGLTSLHYAAESGQEDVVKLVLENTPDPNLTDYMGRTALFVAVQQQSESIATLLLQASIDVNQKDIWDNSALYIAVEIDSEALVLLLLAHGADINM